MFDNWDARKWNAYHHSLNLELPPEKCEVSLTDEEKKTYIERLNDLRKERKANPGMPIMYDETMGLEWK